MNASGMPHILRKAWVSDACAQVAAHEQHAVINCIDYGVQFAQQLFLLPI